MQRNLGISKAVPKIFVFDLKFWLVQLCDKLEHICLGFKSLAAKII